MKKIIFISLSLVLFLFISGCKGTRNVKVEILHSDLWTAILKADSETSNLTDNESATVNLGDNITSVNIEAYKANVTTATLTVRIIEEYEAGFLYLESSEVVATDTTDDPLIPAKCNYKFTTQ